jgi:enterobactin synthetase component D
VIVHLPAFCHSLEYGWPDEVGLESSFFVSAAFNPAMLLEQDFNQSTIPCPKNLRNATVRRRAEFLAGRLCAQQAFLHLTGRPHMPQQGTDRVPIWPRGYVGSISHTKGLAAAVVARRTDYRSLGIDLERPLGDDECTDDLIHAIQIPAERERLASLHTLTRGQALTLAFSIKESVFKALYPLVHIYFDFKDVELIRCDVGGGASLRLLRDLSTEWREGSEFAARFHVGDGYLLTSTAIEAGRTAGFKSFTTSSISASILRVS